MLVDGQDQAVFGGVLETVGGGQMPVARGRWAGDRGVASVLLAFVFLFFGARVAWQYAPLSYLPGDCPYYAATVVSLVHDRDLDLRNQLRGGLEVHGRQIALGTDGGWYPKHPILMPIVAAPFVAAFGVPGVLLFNVLVLGALAVALMQLARPFAPPGPAALSGLLLVAGTFLRRYDYNFSPDLFATLVLVLGLLALVRGKELIGGLLMALAVVAKLTHLFLLPLGLLYVALCRGWRSCWRAVAGAVAPLVALAALNLALFGSPFVTSYDRNVVFRGGSPATVSHRGLFDHPLWSGLVGEIADPQHGLIPTSPVLLLAVPGFVLLFRRHPREAALTLAIGEFVLLFFGTYRHWAASHYGNRFLMPLVAVTSPSVALALQWIEDRLREAAGRAVGTGVSS
jgi:4-amino-4-deoxy-L-arabinose transferase-like glycosyltransferase